MAHGFSVWETIPVNPSDVKPSPFINVYFHLPAKEKESFGLEPTCTLQWLLNNNLVLHHKKFSKLSHNHMAVLMYCYGVEADAGYPYAQEIEDHCFFKIHPAAPNYTPVHTETSAPEQMPSLKVQIFQLG
ncbi:hypothetical protein FQN50_009737 [Emmonsiellopsis sp. PD_5]|nr:hypothetical protein FQN50_009737 [Emmonsiellopsis sp. PD_5]